MSFRIVATVLALAVAGVGQATAQVPVPLAIQLGLGGSFPLGEFADIADSPGYGFSVGTGFQIVPGISVFGGYSWTRFDSDAPTGDVTDSGVAIGLSALLPAMGPVLPWAGASVTLHRLDLADAAQQPDRGGAGLGLGAGVLVPLGPRIHLSPSLGYVRYNSPFPGRDNLVVSYLSAGLSLNVTPW
jgi:hypothetical protein